MANTIKMTADCFVVPNMAATLSENNPALINDDRARVQKLFEINNIEYDMDIDDLAIVQLWWVSTTAEYPSDNIGDHGIYIHGVRYLPKLDFLPAGLFMKKKEGESFSLKVPCGDIIIEFTVTLRQGNYRYRGYGTFEEVLRKVLASVPVQKPLIPGNNETFDFDGLQEKLGFDSDIYSPRDLINYYEEVMKETVLSLSRVQEKADRTLAEIPNMPVDAFETEDRNNMEYLVREITAMLDTVKASTNRKIKTAIGKRAECDKYNALCKRYWGGEE